jgi:hypothetical protein
MIFVTTASRHAIAVDGSENKYFLGALFDCYNTQKWRVTFFNSPQIPSDGSEMSSALTGVYHR